MHTGYDQRSPVIRSSTVNIKIQYSTPAYRRYSALTRTTRDAIFLHVLTRQHPPPKKKCSEPLLVDDYRVLYYPENLKLSSSINGNPNIYIYIYNPNNLITWYFMERHCRFGTLNWIWGSVACRVLPELPSGNFT